MVIVSDQTVGAIHGPALRQSFITAGLDFAEYNVPSGERSKSFDTLAQVFDFLARERVARDGCIVALGGGVVSDLAGVGAAMWLRGIPFAICPTTVESCIDACVGGKTAINVPGGKNLVGAFYHPAFVGIDSECLRTLPPRDVRAGLAESVKHALISSEEFLAWHETNVEKILALEPGVMSELIARNLRVKIDVVQRDPLEQTGERMTLNFGHTIGHAIEECRGYSLRHGECVALGIRAACCISQAMGLLHGEIVERANRLLTRFELPAKLDKPAPFDRLMNTLSRDKKTRGKTVQWVLLESIGKTTIRTDVPESLIRAAYAELM